VTVTTSDPAAARSGLTAGLHPLLLAAYAVLFLWSQNLGEADPGQVVLALGIVVGGAGVLTLVLSVLLRDRRRGALVAAPLVVGGLMYGHVATLVRPFDIPGFVQQGGWVALAGLGVVAALRLGRRPLAAVDGALLRVAAVLVLVTLVLIVPHQLSAATSPPATPDREPIAADTDAPKRDVYFLVFDRYGSDRSLEIRYGVRSSLTGWLRDEGFAVLPGSHANYVRTVLSMATTLNMVHLPDLLPEQSAESTDVRAANARLQDSLVVRQFKALGYRYHHIGSWWDPGRVDAAADVNHVPTVGPIHGDFIEVLHDESALPALTRRFGLPSGTEELRHYRYGTHGLEALESLRDVEGPKFVLAHLLLPHAPLVFHRDGSFLGAAEAAEQGISAAERYQHQLDFTDRRIREIVEGLLARPDAERPIIILSADEGPYPASYSAERRTPGWGLRASEEDLETKYGILNAWYLPGVEDLGLDPEMTAINTFPVLFDRYFGIPYPELPERIFASRDWRHPYDLEDITDRLPTRR
jgi:hypothetical protein